MVQTVISTDKLFGQRRPNGVLRHRQTITNRKDERVDGHVAISSVDVQRGPRHRELTHKIKLHLVVGVSQQYICNTLALRARQPRNHKRITLIQHVVYPHGTTGQKHCNDRNTLFHQRVYEFAFAALVIPSNGVCVPLHFSIRRLSKHHDSGIDIGIGVNVADNAPPCRTHLTLNAVKNRRAAGKIAVAVTRPLPTDGPATTLLPNIVCSRARYQVGSAWRKR